jgi:hypothetical protein
MASLQHEGTYVDELDRQLIIHGTKYRRKDA